MSMLGTLAKVALGVMVAMGVGAAVLRGRTGTGGTGGLFGQANTGQRGGSGGGIEDMLGSILGGKSSGRAGGGLGGMLEQLTGGSARGGSSGQGGITDMISSAAQRGGLGGMLGGSTGGAAGGGLGGLLGGLMGGLGGAAAGSAMGRTSSPQQNTKSFGEMLNASFDNAGEPDIAPTAEQEVAAALMLRAMIQAAKADGVIDAAEKDKLLGKLGDVTEEEMKFVPGELAAPLDTPGLVAQVPSGLERQIYTMSVLAIDLDNQAEADYLNTLAKALNLQAQDVNAIHAELGVAALYA